MTAMSMYQASAPLFRQLLGSMAAELTKAEASASARKIEPAVLLQARLAPDMLPLTRQVQIACDTAKACLARLAGIENPRRADEETSFAQLHERIDWTLAFVDGVPAARVDGSEARAVSVPVARDQTVTMPGLTYLMHRVIPNFVFHCATAHAILRHNGVELGKRDFLGTVPGIA